MGAAQGRRLRYVVIGVASGIFSHHHPALVQTPIELVAVADVNTRLGMQRAQDLGCPFYEDYREMLAKTQPDVAVILTPPFLHASMTIDALEAGCHVLLEKPMALHVAEADAMIEAADRVDRQLGVIFQHRFRPEIQAAHQFLEEGRLGKLQRVEVVGVWLRPASYFRMASWRATWAGEGGGILTNQASHNLDLLCHLLGTPARVSGWTRRLLHATETEDTAHALLEWTSGVLGYVHVTTAEADTHERIKIVGSSGSLEIGQKKLAVRMLDMDVREYSATCNNPYGELRSHPLSISLEPGEGAHSAVYQSFNEALLSGTSFGCDGRQGRMALELANAINYASHTHTEVELPLDRAGYVSLLEQLRQQSAL